MSGFTLVEVVIALIVVQIGVLAALSTMLAAGRILSHAADVERTVAVAMWLTDSLDAAAGSDSIAGVGYTARWGPGSDGRTLIVTSGRTELRVAPAGGVGS